MNTTETVNNPVSGNGDDGDDEENKEATRSSSRVGMIAAVKQPKIACCLLCTLLVVLLGTFITVRGRHGGDGEDGGMLGAARSVNNTGGAPCDSGFRLNDDKTKCEWAGDPVTGLGRTCKSDADCAKYQADYCHHAKARPAKDGNPAQPAKSTCMIVGCAPSKCPSFVVPQPKNNANAPKGASCTNGICEVTRESRIYVYIQIHYIFMISCMYSYAPFHALLTCRWCA